MGVGVNETLMIGITPLWNPDKGNLEADVELG